MVEHAIREGGRVGREHRHVQLPRLEPVGRAVDQARAGHALPGVAPRRASRGRAQFAEQAAAAPGAVPGRRRARLPRAAERRRHAGRAFAPRHLHARRVEDAERLVDGDCDTALAVPAGRRAGRQRRSSIDIELAEPLHRAQPGRCTPAESGWAAQCELQAAGEDGQFRTVRQFPFDRSNMAVNVGPMPRGPVAVSFRAETAKRFRLRAHRACSGEGGLGGDRVCRGAARLERFVEKQLGKMHPTPLPMWDTYLWPTQRAGITEARGCPGRSR